MRNHIKLSVIAIALFSFAAAASAQSSEPVMNTPETEIPANDTQKAKKGWWQFGVGYRIGSPIIYHNEQAVVLSGGYRFNKKNYLGLNVGVAKATDTYTEYGPQDFDYIGCPITLDYTHNFFLGKARKHSIYLGGEVGGTFSFGQTGEIKETDDIFRLEPLGIPVMMIKTGMDFQLYKRLHLNFGVRVGILGVQGSIGISF